MFVRLENTNEHNKFYEMLGYAYVDNETNKDNSINLTIRYGIINCEGRTIFKQFKDRAELWDFVRRKTDEKLRKGYKIVKSRE